MFQLEGEVGIAQKELVRLANIKNVADLDKKDELIQLQKENVKEKEIRNSELRS